jgi:anti-sigma factor RsiW
MSHLDEGLLTAFLDEELSEAERRSAESHLAACPECRRLFDELKAFAAEADGLVGAVEVPPRAGVPAAPSPEGVANRPRNRVARWRGLAWAASVVLALGLGWLASDLRYPGSSDQLSQRKADGEAAATLPAPRETLALTPSPGPAAHPAPEPGRASQVTSQTAPLREEKAPSPSVPTPAMAAPTSLASAEQAGRPDHARVTVPSLDQPAATGDLARDAAKESDARNKIMRDRAAAPATPPAAQMLDSRGRDGLAARRNLAGFRQVKMQEGVRTLGGSMRLIDGLEPQRILVGPGTLASGGNPSDSLVRVVYEDPPGRELWLDQQRLREAEPVAGFAAAGMLPGDTILTRDTSGLQSVRWHDEHGFQLALTGHLSADSLLAMIRRVH